MEPPVADREIPQAKTLPQASEPDEPWASTIVRIADVAAARPQAIAVCAGATAMSYAALMSAAAALAAELDGLGLGAEVPVAVCLPRSFAHVVSFVGVLQAGAVIVPIDPAWPRERIAAVLDDVGAAVVITTAGLAHDFSAGHRTVLVRDPTAPPAPATSMPSHIDAANPEQIAYVIYTSGSTGPPKGVEITQRNLANLVDWHIAAFAVGPQDRASSVAGLSFDALVWELLPALAAGAAVHLVPEEARTSATALQRWLADEGITVAFVPTPLAETLLASEWPEVALRLLLTGGDTLHVWPRPGLPFTVVNNYGPTECAVVATSGIVSPGERGTLPSIGRPIANSQIHILGPNGEPALAGEIGEIHVGGANVGRGYRGQPGLTAEKFVTRRLAGTAQRLYRTGDLGRWTVDGEIEFHGRRDMQLKIRGYRIEPDEVSALLDRHPLVVQSAVVGRGTGAQCRLVAYVVPKEEAVPRAGELREFLAQSLPDYMVPALFVRVMSLPLTANAKLDRAALPAPMPANALPDVQYRAPAAGVEARIASMVEELLALQTVGADDNFFLLGGHSLLGTQLVLRLRDAFGVELKLRDLFDAPTVGELARLVERVVTRLVMAMNDDEIRRLMP